MTILSFMTIVTVFVFTIVVTRFLVLRILVWLKPEGYIELSYVDNSGLKHSRKLRVGHGEDSKELLSILREIKSSPKVKAR
ncbi:hypothetical protein BV923_22940 [Pectobacterium odoriferum]|nr:hypothetical protein BV923_22940 [Pectobacterium odoriferum]